MSAGLSGDKSDTVLDLYCGAGALALPLAKDAQRVVGADTNPQAVENAMVNAERNGIRNASFHVLNLYLEKDVATLAQRVPSPDVIIAGPHCNPFHAAGKLPSRDRQTPADDTDVTFRVPLTWQREWLRVLPALPLHVPMYNRDDACISPRLLEYKMQVCFHAGF